MVCIVYWGGGMGWRLVYTKQIALKMAQHLLFEKELNLYVENELDPNAKDVTFSSGKDSKEEIRFYR